MSLQRLRVFTVVLALATLSACASDPSATSTDDSFEQPAAFGQPGDPADADRTVDITTGNELVFDPEEVTVAQGETVTFVITNDGDLMHDFVIGDEAAQEAHAEEMAMSEDEMEMEGNDQDANAVSVPAGQTVELTWVFDGETDGLLYGCHEPGHYEAGMVGEIIVER